MKLLPLAAVILLCALPCARAQSPITVTATPHAPSNVPAELLDPALLGEVTRHLYRWYVDESDIEKADHSPDLILWVGLTTPALDAGDKSQFARILLPLPGITVQLKKADYVIAETGTAVKSNGFKITSVSRGLVPASLPAGYVELKLGMAKLKEHLFATRHQQDFPGEALIERLKVALVKELNRQKTPGVKDLAEIQTVYLGSLSPMSNDLWVYWENRKWLVHCTSDIDLANPAVWSQENLSFRRYDTLTQVVVSMDEAAGSNRFMTRDQIGRALYNCLVLGKRVQITPSALKVPHSTRMHRR
jgi:hypothetical protein